MPELSGIAIGCTGCISILLLVILLPLSFSYLNYWEYGLLQHKITGNVSTERIYSQGRYFVGVSHKFLKYQADAHHLKLDDLEVFSDGGSDSVGLSFFIDVDLTYFLNQEEVGKLHQDLGKTYQTVVLSRTNDAIKNSATTVKLKDYFQNRKVIEEQLRVAIQKRWDAKPTLHMTIDQFHLGRIQIPDAVAEKQLTAKIQIETNKKEEFLQKARIEREITSVEVNTIALEKVKLLKETRAQASLVTANAIAEAEKIKSAAINAGTKALLLALDISSQEHSTAYTYIRTLQNRQSGGTRMKVSYLADENIVKTITSV